MGRTRRDWIVCHDATQGRKAYALECLRCGALQPITTPVSIDCYVKFAKAFEQEHRRCRPRPVAPEVESGE